MRPEASPVPSPITGVRRVGACALLIEARSATDVPAIAAAIRAHLASPVARWQAVDIVPAARTVLLAGLTSDGGTPVTANTVPISIDAIATELRTWTIPPLAADAGRLITLPVVFDGPDLAAVAAHWDATAGAVVARILDIEFRVGFSGFAPGFAYLTGLPEHMAVPRRDTPRTRVPAGSVGLAGQYCGVYPRESPGGWQIIGRAVDTTLWDTDREPPALLEPGVRVRFRHE